MLPQGAVVEVAHRPCGSAVPAGTLAQVPALPSTLQAWQVAHDVDAAADAVDAAEARQAVGRHVQVCPSRFLVPHRFVFGSQMSG